MCIYHGKKICGRSNFPRSATGSWQLSAIVDVSPSVGGGATHVQMA